MKEKCFIYGEHAPNGNRCCWIKKAIYFHKLKKVTLKWRSSFV